MEVMLVKEEITDDGEMKDDIVSGAMHEDDKFTGNEKSEYINDVTNMQYSLSLCDFLKKVKRETEFKINHEEIHIKAEQLFQATNSDSDANSNDKLQNEADNTPENISMSRRYPTRKISLNNSRQSDKKPIKTYECEVCNKTYNHLISLKIHKRVHTGEKPYKCNYCGKLFSAGYGLIKHTRTHTRERLYKCDVCSKAFHLAEHLRVHKGIHTGEKPYECDVCKQAFRQKGTLNDHKHVHTGARPHKCDVCDIAFAYRNNLRAHKRIHTRERPYECDVCKKAFTRKSFLLQHQLIHNDNKFKCDVCNNVFAQLRGLIRHIKRIHEEKVVV